MREEMMGKFKSYEDFEADYEEYNYIDKVSDRYYPQKSLNRKQLQRYYLQYVKKWKKAHGGGIQKDDKAQSDDSKLSAIVRERDGGCRLLKLLSLEEVSEWKRNQNGLGGILDVAHVFGKGAFPWMRYDDKNVVTLNRFSHNCLDAGKSPINGKQITDAQRNAWWQRIIGNDWGYLKRKANKLSTDE
jgi:hypothetical protein